MGSKEEARSGPSEPGLQGGTTDTSNFSRQKIKTFVFLKALNYHLHPQIYKPSPGSNEEARSGPLELGLQEGQLIPQILARK